MFSGVSPAFHSSSCPHAPPQQWTSKLLSLITSNAEHFPLFMWVYGKKNNKSNNYYRPSTVSKPQLCRPLKYQLGFFHVIGLAATSSGLARLSLRLLKPRPSNGRQQGIPCIRSRAQKDGSLLPSPARFLLQLAPRTSEMSSTALR